MDGHLVPAPKVSDLERVDCILPTHIFLRHPHNPNRDLKQWRRGRRRQREPQKSTSFKTALNSARALHFFCTFLWRHCTTTMWSFLILRFMEDVNTRQRFSFPFSQLRYSLLEKHCQHLACEQALLFGQAKRVSWGAEDPRGFAARSRALARLVSLAQIGELARRLPTFDELNEIEKAR